MSGEENPAGEPRRAAASVIKSDRTRLVSSGSFAPVQTRPTQVRVGAVTPTATEIHVHCSCGRETIVVAEHDPGVAS